MNGNGNFTCFSGMIMSKRLSQGKKKIGGILNNLPNWPGEWICTGTSLFLCYLDTTQDCSPYLIIFYMMSAVSIQGLLCLARFHCLIIDQTLMTRDLSERYVDCPVY
jgi:hypothetical protein